MTADNYHMIQARKRQEAPLRLAQGAAILAELEAKTGDARRAARADRMRAEEILRQHGFRP